MHHKISRRAALAAGTAATGLMFHSNPSVSHAWTLPDVWGEDFLPQWSPGDHVERDLTPGETPIRLCCTSYGLSNTNGRNITEKKRLKFT